MPQPSFNPTHVSADVRHPRRSTFIQPALKRGVEPLSLFDAAYRSGFKSLLYTHVPHSLTMTQAIASLNRARWGDNVYIPVHKGCVSAGCNNRRTQPHYWAKSNTYSNAPVSNRAHNTTNGILRFLVTCRAADFNDTGFVSSAVHQVDTWLPADFSAGTYQILTVTQHGYRHAITLKSTAFIREIATKTLPLHYKPITNQSAMFALTTSYCRGRY